MNPSDASSGQHILNASLEHSLFVAVDIPEFSLVGKKKVLIHPLKVVV
jgi:hypothetical protein